MSSKILFGSILCVGFCQRSLAKISFIEIINVSGDAMTILNSLLALEVITSALFSFSKSFLITSISFFKDRAVAFCISIDSIDSSISLKIHR